MAQMTDQDWDQYGATINEVATRIAGSRRMDPATKSDFLESIPFKMVTAWDNFDPEKGEFGAWCTRVLSNHRVSVIRKHARWNNMADDIGVDLEADRREDHVEGIARRELANNAVDALEHHVKGFDRLLVAIDCQLLCRLTTERAARWLRDAETLPPEFRWRDIEAIPNPAERRRALAAALGHDGNWLRQRINRALRRIRRDGNPPP